VEGLHAYVKRWDTAIFSAAAEKKSRFSIAAEKRAVSLSWQRFRV
jgi:hypothetical protein